MHSFPITASDTRFNVKPLMNITSTTATTDAVYSLKTSQSHSFTLLMSSEQREAAWQRNHGGRSYIRPQQSVSGLSPLLPVTDFESYPRSAGPGHCGPEEASPVGVLEDVGQDAGEQAGAVQDNLALFLRGAARVCTLDQPLHSLRKKHM